MDDWDPWRHRKPKSSPVARILSLHTQGLSYILIRLVSINLLFININALGLLCRAPKMIPHIGNCLGAIKLPTVVSGSSLIELVWLTLKVHLSSRPEMVKLLYWWVFFRIRFISGFFLWVFFSKWAMRLTHHASWSIRLSTVQSNLHMWHVANKSSRRWKDWIRESG